MQYILLIYGDEQGWSEASAEDVGKMMQEYDDYTRWLRDSGRYVAGEALQTTDQATTVRVRDGETMTTDGPFAETKEQLGGFYVIEAADLDEAIEAARRLPAAAYGSVEVRPIMDFSGQEG
jgi:hypothetical protein